MLRWAGCDDLDVAAALGADVPFCLVGGRARVRGVGEVLEPLPLEDRTFTLVVPPLQVSTVAVYRAWDELGGPPQRRTERPRAGRAAVEPGCSGGATASGEATGRAPVLAGSGATWFLDGSHPGLAGPLAPATCLVTRTDRP